MFWKKSSLKIPKILRETASLLTLICSGTALFRRSPQEVFCKKMFLKISQNSQKNTCARVSFLIKLQAWDFCLLKSCSCLVISQETLKFSKGFFRSKSREVLRKNGFLKNFTIFTGKHLCWSWKKIFKEIFKNIDLLRCLFRSNWEKRNMFQ